jgi:hypothetical protein
MISVILVQYNNAALTLQAVHTLRQHHDHGFEILVVDNASTDGSRERVREISRDAVIIENRENIGYGAANNIAASRAHGDILFFLNNDTISTRGYLEAAEQEFEAEPTIGILGPRLLNEDGTFQLSAGWLPSFSREIVEKFLYGAIRKDLRIVQRSVETFFLRRRDVGWVTGAALFIRKGIFDRIGGFDEGMFMYFEDKDICARVWEAGMRVVYDPLLSLVHLKGGSSPDSLSPFLRNVYRSSQRRYYQVHRPTYEKVLLNVYLRMTGPMPHD